MRLQFAATVLLSLLLTFGCGGGDGEESTSDVQGSGEDQIVVKDPIPVVNEMTRLTPENFLGQVDANPTLKALWEALRAEGFTSIMNAGLTRQDDGTQVLWGEAQSTSDNRRGLIQHCFGDDCVSAIFKVENGQMTWTDASGGAVESRGVGLPVLLKQLKGHTFDKPTEVVELGADVPSELPEISVDKRRLYMLNSFGPLWAEGVLSLDPVRNAAIGSGAFTDVLAFNYVTMDDVDSALSLSHPFDAMVWLGQGVREEAITNEVFKPIGMTANAGLFGDVLYDLDRFKDTINANPLRGPGLIVLAACESMGDGNGGGEMTNSLPVALDNKARILVGFKGCGDARDLVQATRLFLEKFLAGETLAASLDAANGYLQAFGGISMATTPEADVSQKFLSDLGTFWEQFTDAGVPETATFSVNINIANQCTDESGKKYSEDEAFVTAWSKEIVWDGPFFSGTRTNPDHNVDVKFRGALVDLRPGAHFFFVLEGSLGPKVSDLTLYGDGVIQNIKVDKEKPNEFVIEFDGTGITTNYVNEAGHDCIMQPPLLVTTTGGYSTFTIPVPWKGE